MNNHRKSDRWLQTVNIIMEKSHSDVIRMALHIIQLDRSRLNAGFSTQHFYLFIPE